MSAGMLGFAICNGYRLPVTRMDFDQGRLHILLEGAGPMILEGPVTLFGVDGVGVCQASDVPRQVLDLGQTVGLHLQMRIDTVKADALRWRG